MAYIEPENYVSDIFDVKGFDFIASIEVNPDGCTTWWIEAIKNSRVVDTCSYEALVANCAFEDEPKVYRASRTKDFKEWLSGLEEEFSEFEETLEIPA